MLDVDGETGALHFPDVPKLELDQLIDQLVERAEGVKRAQGRLRSLLTAIEAVAGQLDLDAVLTNIVQAGCDLAAARYGALGVVAEDGTLEQFVHVGMDAETEARIGGLPQGKGLLGALVVDQRPIRLAVMSDDPRSVGFPAGHPPMTSFLGVPIRVRGEVFGNLYLTDCAKGEFSAEDEELIAALALAAGTAISNARLYHESRLQQRWLAASVEISAQLLRTGGEDPLRMVARHALEVSDADTVSVGLLTSDSSHLVVEVAFGAGSADLVGQRYPVAEILAGQVVEAGEPLLVTAATRAGQRSSHVATVLDAGPVMILPLGRAEHVRGVLSLVRRRGRGAFGRSDLEMAAGFAAHASVALELADTRAAEQKLVLLEDRDRIARDLHDHVIQELFAIGLSLETVAAMLGPDHRASQRVRDRVDDIDRTIRRIRTSIFELRGSLDAAPGGLREDLLHTASDLTPAMGFAPHVAFSGPVDLVVDAGLADDVSAVVREALTNVAKHARATTASVDLSVTTDEVAVTITDNGVGIDQHSWASGIANLRSRAEQRNGQFRLAHGADGGAVLTWKAQLR